MQDPERDPKERTLIFVQTKKNADFCPNVVGWDAAAAWLEPV